MRLLAIAGIFFCSYAFCLTLLAEDLKVDEIIPARIMTLPVKEDPTLCFPQSPVNTFLLGDRVNLKELQHYPERKLWLVEGLSVFGIRGKEGYCDQEGKIVIPAQFERADNFHNGLAVIQLAGKYGYIDPTGKFVIKPRFERAENFNEKRAVVAIDGKYGYIDLKGEVVIEPKYSSAATFYAGRAIVRLDNKFGILRPDGEWITQPTYKNLYRFGDGIVAENFDDRLGIIDEHGNVDYDNFSEKYDAIFERMMK